MAASGKQESLVRKAAEEFARGNYFVALDLYRRLSDQLGEENFRANIQLCNRRLSRASRKNAFVHEELIEEAKNIPLSNGCRHYKKLPIKTGIITDVYMFNYYRDVFDEIHYLTPDNCERILKDHALDMILYVSCWKGINNEWKEVNPGFPPMKALELIIDTARKQGASLVFQSIEDPSNFEHFLPVAKKFDHIFTSDTDCIEKYKRECGHERVYHGEYGVNPLLNNPIACRRRLRNAAFFAGSWAARYKERCDDMEMVFDSILSSGAQLLIADRNHGSDSREHRYPERYGTIAPINHELLQSVHKLFRYNLNFNSIKNSPTMCAMRVYELQAMGVGIFSNYARSVFNRFPEIRILPWRADLSGEFTSTPGLEEYRRNMARLREVLNDRTAFDISLRLCGRVGFKLSASDPAVAILCREKNAVTNRNCERQAYQPCVVIDELEIDTQVKWDSFVKNRNIAYFTWFNEGDEYEENYLNDLVNAFKYTAAAYVTREAWFHDGVFHDGLQHDYTRRMAGKARTLFSADVFSPLEFMEHEAHAAIEGLDGGYAIDPFELNYRSYLECQRAAVETTPPALSIIVPVFNNGRFLQAKCIESLRRNQAWNAMEVLLIDDGSSDAETLCVIKNLLREHRTIRASFFADGGSGSASRPRNKGIDLATAPLVAFLDPDNEISPQGYDNLLAIFAEAVAQHEEVDFVSGYHVKVEAQARSIGQWAVQRLLIVDDLKGYFLGSGRFPVIPTQPALIRRRLFEDGGLRFVEKAVGQDTLFGWELLCQARKGAFTDAAYLIYYAQRAGSVVNTIDRAYFEKARILEGAQIAMLDRYSLMEAYLENRYERFMQEWYRPKLQSIPDEAEREQCLSILDEIARMYGRENSARIRANDITRLGVPESATPQALQKEENTDDESIDREGDFRLLLEEFHRLDVAYARLVKNIEESSHSIKAALQVSGKSRFRRALEILLSRKKHAPESWVDGQEIIEKLRSSFIASGKKRAKELFGKGQLDKADVVMRGLFVDPAHFSNKDSLVLMRDIQNQRGALSHLLATERRLDAFRKRDESPVRCLEGRIRAVSGWYPRVAGPKVQLRVNDDVVLHLVKESRPYCSNGFASRSHYNFLAEKAVGLQPVVITEPGFPENSLPGEIPKSFELDGITHHRLDVGPQAPRKALPLDTWLEEFAQLAYPLARSIQPGVIHASSGRRGYDTALVGLALKAKTGLPLVYEVRSFFEGVWTQRLEREEKGEIFQRRYATETLCMNLADAVITLCESMRQEIIGRGIDPEKVFLVPNGVDIDRFPLTPRDTGLAAELGILNLPSFGYVSNLDHYREGQETLVRTAAVLQQRGLDFRCVLVGGGPRGPMMTELAKELGVIGKLILTGPVDHNAIAAYYSLIDVFVVPRIDERAARYVTPLKPFEAMSIGRPVVVSDLPALREIVDAPRRGLLFPPGDHIQLADLVERLWRDRDLSASLVSQARQWIEKERTWAMNGPRYREAFLYARQHCRNIP